MQRLMRSALAVVSLVLAGRAGAQREAAAAPPALPGDPPALGIHWARGLTGAASTSPDLVWHGGAILTSGWVQSIFWGTKWTDPARVGDKITGLDTFYSQVGGTAYARTWSEYSGSNGQVGTGVSYGGHLLDTSAAPSHAPRTRDILAEVCKLVPNPVAYGYYPVFVDQPRGRAGYCAWHSYGTCNGVPIEFGFFFWLDGDPGCDPRDTWTTHSQGLAALANVSGHEISETATDPSNGGWWDSSGQENADKCAWTFNKPVGFSGSTWKIQGNWSNAAYDGGQTGYASGGCVDGN
jgi:hypothetical protein